MSLNSHLAELNEKHRNLDRKIDSELTRPACDETTIAKLKREKLRLKDEITKLQARVRH